MTWDETARSPRDYSVQLAFTTNVQFFDEEKFHELKDLVEVIVLSIDSHIPEVFEQIRPRADAARIYENLETVARLCEEHGVEPRVQIVFMTLNAPHMPDLIAAMADRGARVMNVIQMIDVNRHSWHLDATMHLSSEYLAWVKAQCVAVAEERKLKLGWYLADHEFFDFTDPERGVFERESKRVNDRRDTDMRFRHPGFCKYAYDRVRLRADGYISPCGLDCDGELEWGNLGEQHFDELWNGRAAQDLRRGGHYTWDYPRHSARACRYVDLAAPTTTRPVLDRYLTRSGHGPQDLEPGLSIWAPEHMLRNESAPVILLDAPRGADSSYHLVTSLGGFDEGMVVVELVPTAARRTTSWSSGSGRTPGAGSRRTWGIGGRSSSLTAARRWRAPRRCGASSATNHFRGLPTAILNYPDEEHFAPVYLGGNREAGMGKARRTAAPPTASQERCGAGARKAVRPAPHARRRLLHMRSGRHLMRTREMVGHVRDVIGSAVPEGAVVLVATKGDPELLVDGRRMLRHFPADGDGMYAGFHPPDDAWAIERLEQARC